MKLPQGEKINHTLKQSGLLECRTYKILTASNVQDVLEHYRIDAIVESNLFRK